MKFGKAVLPAIKDRKCICLCCDKVFICKTGNQKYCSGKCLNKVKNKKFCQKHNIKSRYDRNKYFHKCEICNSDFFSGKKKTHFCSSKCSGLSQRRYLDVPDCLENASRKIDKNIGYVRIYCPMHKRANTWGYVYEHVIIAERKIGRELFTDEVVHHKDGIRWNNDPNNLEVMDRIEHSKLNKRKNESDE